MFVVIQLYYSTHIASPLNAYPRLAMVGAFLTLKTTLLQPICGNRVPQRGSNVSVPLGSSEYLRVFHVIEQ